VATGLHSIPDMSRKDQLPSPPLLDDQRLDRVRAAAELEHILAILRLTRGNRARAARILGISRKTLWKKLKLLGPSSACGVTPR